ncbi:carboxypeptidase regulatory-like domain-containing protein [Aquimarina rubra]|uniref:Carboxypeptidase regulatory-like domain-containing protein n=1 Tax=Aquimarina rubra TaxID=1920033 RepID=A0ABW5L8J0_9FLAO
MRTLFVLVLLCVVQSTFAQVELKGTVKDSVGNPLELANVVAINQETKILQAYGTTDAKGNYKLNLSKNTEFKLTVSYIGMEDYEEVISVGETDISKNVVLKFGNTLDEVQITYEMPVTVKGDTLIYNAESFNTGTERKLEDVLQNLPGVEINEEGQVEVEGKVVNKLMVNGKDFFDGDTKVATKNIPSKAVDKIQVLRNYSEVGQLRGVTNNQDNVALNIKLKEGKESFWFGNVTAGGGFSPDEGLYLAQPKLFYYSPKYSINFIGDINNTGEVALSRRDIRGFGGGFRAPSRTSGTSINLGNNDLSFLTNQNNATAIQNKLGAANFSYSPNKSLDISGFAIFNVSRLSSRQSNFIQYTDADLGIPDESTDENNEEKSDQGLLKLSASYKPNVNNQIDYDILGRISKDVQDQNFASSILGTTTEAEDATPYSINQSLKYYYTLDEDNIFALEVDHLLRDEDPFYNARLINDPGNNNEVDPNDRDPFDNTAEALGLDTSLLNYNLGQNRRIKSNQLDAKLDYFYIINAKSNLNVTLGTIFSQQKFNSRLFQFLDNNAQFDPTPTFNEGRATNDTEYTFSDVYLGFHYRFKTGKFIFTPGFSVHSYVNENSQFNQEFDESFFRLLPDFETRIQFKKNESLTFRYDMQNQFTDVTRLAQGLVLNNFNSIQFGEPELQNALSHNLSLFYSSFNLFNYTNIFARLAYSKNIDQIRGLTNFDNVITTSTFFNSNFADENFSAFGRIQRTFGKVRATMNTSFNYTKINQFIQDRRSVNEGFTQSYRPGLRTNFKKAPNVSVQYNYSITTNTQGSNKTTFYTNAPSIDFDAYIWKSLTFVTDYTYTRQSRKDGPSQSFDTWNASLSYRKDKDAKWEYTLRATNILDVTSRVNNRATNLFVSSTETFILPRFITFRLRYVL